MIATKTGTPPTLQTYCARVVPAGKQRLAFVVATLTRAQGRALVWRGAKLGRTRIGSDLAQFVRDSCRDAELLFLESGVFAPAFALLLSSKFSLPTIPGDRIQDSGTRVPGCYSSA